MSPRRSTRPAGTDEVPTVVRSEETLRAGTVSRRAGAVRVRKRVEEEPAQQVVPRSSEHVQLERTEPDESDSGLVETLADGSISIPVFEERLVVEKKLVVRERVIIRKVSVTENHRVEAQVRRERVEIDADPEVASRVHDEPARQPKVGKQSAPTARRGTAKSAAAKKPSSPAKRRAT